MATANIDLNRLRSLMNVALSARDRRGRLADDVRFCRIERQAAEEELRQYEETPFRDRRYDELRKRAEKARQAQRDAQGAYEAADDNAVTANLARRCADYAADTLGERCPRDVLMFADRV